MTSSLQNRSRIEYGPQVICTGASRSGTLHRRLARSRSPDCRHYSSSYAVPYGYSYRPATTGGLPGFSTRCSLYAKPRPFPLSHGLSQVRHPSWGTLPMCCSLQLLSPGQDRFADHLRAMMQEILSGYHEILCFWQFGQPDISEVPPFPKVVFETSRQHGVN
jgi:hypothetical protein